MTSFSDLISYIELIELLGYDINLFRGQTIKAPLLPSICRNDPKVDTTGMEKDMLEDFKRRSSMLVNRNFTDWEWLIYAQHFGLKTRLLDWTSNPLVAIWFACQSTDDSNSYLYVLSCDDKMRLDTNENPSPFETSTTKILRPALNNERIIAQYGWFTAHKYSKKAGKFVKLETNTKMKQHLTEIEIPGSSKKDFLRKLSLFGVNNGTIYPDINGLSLHLNWKYLANKY